MGKFWGQDEHQAILLDHPSSFDLDIRAVYGLREQTHRVTAIGRAEITHKSRRRERRLSEELQGILVTGNSFPMLPKHVSSSKYRAEQPKGWGGHVESRN